MANKIDPKDIGAALERAGIVPPKTQRQRTTTNVFLGIIAGVLVLGALVFLLGGVA